MNWQWHLEQVLVSWIVDGARRERLQVAVPPDPDGVAHDRIETWPIDAVVYELWDDDNHLPEVAGVRLGLPPLTTYAHAVRLLWSLCAGDLSPARTYPEAARYMTALPADILHRHHARIDEGIAPLASAS